MPVHRSKAPLARAAVILLATVCIGLSSAWWAEHRRRLETQNSIVDIHGSVTLDGRPLSGSRIFFAREGGNFVGAEITGGTFQIPDMPAGDWSVRIEGDAVPALYSAGMDAEVKPNQREFRFGLKGQQALAAATRP